MHRLGFFLLGAVAGGVGAGAAAWLYGGRRGACKGSSRSSLGCDLGGEAECRAGGFKKQRVELAEKMELILESCREFAGFQESGRRLSGGLEAETEERIRAIRLECAELDLIRANFETASAGGEASTYEPGLLVKILKEVRGTAGNLLADKDFIAKERHFVEDIRMLRRTTGNLLKFITGKDEPGGARPEPAHKNAKNFF